MVRLCGQKQACYKRPVTALNESLVQSEGASIADPGGVSSHRLRSAEDVQKRLARIEQRSESAAAEKARRRLLFDVLEAIAHQSADRPAEMAALLLRNIRLAEFLQAAEPYAPVIEQSVLDYLYEKSRVGWPRSEWEKEVLKASSLYVALSAQGRDLKWDSLLDNAAAEQAFARSSTIASNGKGLLLLTCHTGYVAPAIGLLRKRIPSAAHMGPRGLVSRELGRVEDIREATFAAHKVLRDGGVVLIAPDAGKGRQTTRLEVFGHATFGGDGAAFLAHSSSCATAWYTVIRTGDRFVPVIELGPIADDGEPLNAFSQRLGKFYSRKLEDLFSGDPRNISLSNTWTQRFLEASAEA